MAKIRGERFRIDLSDEEIEPETTPAPEFIADVHIGDVQERMTTAAAPPKFQSKVTGFPAHKKRTGVSKFKQNRAKENIKEDTNRPAAEQPKRTSADQLPNSDFYELERRKIDEENRKRLGDMSDAEIEQERKELFASLKSTFIQSLLKRSNIDDEPSVGDVRLPSDTHPSEKTRRPSQAPRKVSFALPDEVHEEKEIHPTASRHSISDISVPTLGNELLSEQDGTTTADSKRVQDENELAPMHFPKPPTAPELDPTSSSFFDDLHEKYFPNLAHDPSKLAWMTSPNSEEDSSYNPAQTALDPAALRFSFKGALIPPSKASSLSTDLGLHHHGDAPSAAGYTIAELAMLARSSFPPQRCIAFQTLGRILFRLGIGEFGVESDIDLDGPEGERAKLAKGLWAAIKYNRVLDTLTEEANKEKGHQTSIALAQEAVWNWRRGGGRELKAV
jgi:hypothetical protein